MLPPQCGAFTGALTITKLKAPLYPRQWGGFTLTDTFTDHVAPAVQAFTFHQGFNKLKAPQFPRQRWGWGRVFTLTDALIQFASEVSQKITF